MALLAAMREAGVRKLVFSSTAATYGEPEQVPIVETAPTDAHQPVRRLQARRRPHDQRRGARPTGWAPSPCATSTSPAPTAAQGERHDPESHLIPLVLQVAQGRREAISVFGDDYPTPDGTCVRDYIHVADLAEAHLLAARRPPPPGEHLICNLGNGNGFSVREVSRPSGRSPATPIPEIAAPRRAGDPAVLVASAATRPRAAGLEARPAPTSRRSSRDAWTFAQARYADSAQAGTQ